MTLGVQTTYRLMKIDGLETACEDYGQAVEYKGDILGDEKSFLLDHHHIFTKGKVQNVCGNTYKMLHDTRFKEHFNFLGSFDTHHGIFKDCGEDAPFKTGEVVTSTSSTKGSSCC